MQNRNFWEFVTAVLIIAFDAGIIYSAEEVFPSIITIPLTYDASDEYYLDASFGTPEQPFSLVVDTASYFTAFPSSKYQKSNTKRRFNADSSISYKPTGRLFKEANRSGYIDVKDGVQAFDMLTLGPIRMKHTAYIAEAVTLASPSAQYDGVLGLSPRKYDVRSPLLFQLYKKGFLQKPMFTTFLKKTSENGGDGGALTLGGIDKVNCKGHVHYVETGPNGYALDLWMAVVENFVINGKTISCGDRCQGQLDTTYPYIYGPLNYIEKINRMLGADNNDYEYVPEIDCSTIENLPEIEIIFKGFKVTMTYEDYITQRYDDDGSPICKTVFFREKERPNGYLTLGSPFLKQVCTVFEYETVGKLDDEESIKVGFMKPRQN